MLKIEHHFINVHFANYELLLLGSGGCYWPAKKTLIVSDLHLEKGSYFAARGQPLPLADTRDTLEKMHEDIIRWQPETVICLGDNVHDAQAFLRMTTQDLLYLESLCTNVVSWKWIVGNHDRLEFNNLPLHSTDFFSEVLIDGLCFTHDVQPEQPLQIIGHYHPKISIKRNGAKISGKCFSLSNNRLIMPAYGSYTGGLDVDEPIYKEILSGVVNHYILFNQHIFLVR